MLYHSTDTIIGTVCYVGHCPASIADHLQCTYVCTYERNSGAYSVYVCVITVECTVCMCDNSGAYVQYVCVITVEFTVCMCDISGVYSMYV